MMGTEEGGWDIGGVRWRLNDGREKEGWEIVEEG